MISLKSLLNEDDSILGNAGVVPLSKIPKSVAVAAIDTGKEDGEETDDTFSNKKVAVPASDLRASQTEIIPEKAVGIAISMILDNKIGGDLGAIASKDNYIMDGHHRWAATVLADPTANITVTRIGLPAQQLVTALNFITAAKGKTGNPGKGDIKQFTGDTIAKVLDNLLTNGSAQTKPEDVTKALEILGNGSADTGKEIMMSNADSLPKDIMPGAPDRIDMPVIDADEVEAVASKISSGEIDLKTPYSPDVNAELEIESIIKTTFMRRANIKL